MFYQELCADIWGVFDFNMQDIREDSPFALTEDELCNKLTGMRRVIAISHNCGLLSKVEKQALCEFISDCKHYVRSYCGLFVDVE